MYTGFPYMIPNIGMQTVAPAASGLANAANLGNAATAIGHQYFQMRKKHLTLLTKLSHFIIKLNQFLKT